MFDLKQPCVNCPFRKGLGETFRLRQERLTGIFDAPAFQCHKTFETKPQQCAGLMALLIKEKMPNQIMRVAITTGFLDPELLDPKNEAYTTIEEVRRAHEGANE